MSLLPPIIKQLAAHGAKMLGDQGQRGAKPQKPQADPRESSSQHIEVKAQAKPEQAKQDAAEKSIKAKSFEQLTKIKEHLNEELEQKDIGLKFNVSEKTDRFVVQVVNRKSGEVVRQIPPEEMLELSRNLEKLSGLLVNTRS